MKKLTITAVTLLVVGLAYWLISPQFTDKKVAKEPILEEENVATENFLLTELFEDVEVGNALQSFNEQGNVKIFNGIEFTLIPTPNPIVGGEETILTYNLMIDGRPASDMQTQDSVYGKGVAVHRESLERTPVNIVRRATPHGTLEFRTIFPRSGEYKIFTQFKRNGEIITTDFGVLVR